MTEGTIYEELAKLVRYNGDDFVEGADGMAAAKRFDALRSRTHELASRVLDAGAYDEVPATELVRGDLIVIQWADGSRSIEQVVRTEVDSNEAGNRRTFEGGKMVPSKPWIYVVTTQTGGRFRTLGFCGGPVETAVRKRIRLAAPVVEEELDEASTEAIAELVAVFGSGVTVHGPLAFAFDADLVFARFVEVGGNESIRPEVVLAAVVDGLRALGWSEELPELVEVDAGVFLPPSEADRFEARRESLLSGPDFDEVVAAVAAEGLREGARVECEVYGPGDVRRIEPSGAALVSFDRGALVHVSPSTLSAVYS